MEEELNNQVEGITWSVAFQPASAIVCSCAGLMDQGTE